MKKDRLTQLQGQKRRWVEHDPLLGLPLIAIGVIWFLIAMLVPYCDVMGVPAIGLTFFGVMFMVRR